MKKRALYLVLPMITLILELLPYGAVGVFANGPGETVRITFSYFDPVPFGYANITPLLTAVMTCLLLALLVLYWWIGSSRVLRVAKALACVGAVLSLGPLLLGIRFCSPVGALISASLIGESVWLLLTAKAAAAP